MLSKIIALGTLLAIIVLAISLQITTPTGVGPLGILGVLALIYVSVTGLLAYFLFYLGHLMSRYRVRSATPSLRQSYYYASAMGLFPIILIALQSIAGLRLYDIVLAIVFEVIALVYMTKKHF